MKQSLLIFYFFSLLFTSSKNVIGQIPKSNQRTTIAFEKGNSLGSYYPLDSIQNIKLHNLKGDHVLSEKKRNSLILHLKGYTFDGKYAKTKPGHIWGTIFFSNGITLPFYSNTQGDIIIRNNGRSTFISKSILNFDNY